MSIKDKFTVRRVQNQFCKEWVLKKHYAQRWPSDTRIAFGFFDENNYAIGCALFGHSGNRHLNTVGGYDCLELTRLICDVKDKKNVLSYCLAQALSQIDRALILVSYADARMNHHGYIYQATNWIYTGLSSSSSVYIKGDKVLHSKSFSNAYGSGSKETAALHGFQIVKTEPKHRYFYFVGSKKDKRKMMLALPYKQKPYPKGDNSRYDDSFKPVTQTVLF